MPEIVTDKTAVVVGKYYKVPCAQVMIISFAGKETGTVYNVPILGVEHADKTFPFTKRHYHIDGRFCKRGDDEIDAYTVTKDGKTNVIVITDNEYLEGRWANFRFSRIVYKNIVAKSTTTGLDFSKKEVPEKIADWQKKMIGKSCAGKRCPHLGTTMHESDGFLVCPLHNLRGDIHTEKIIEANNI